MTLLDPSRVADLLNRAPVAVLVLPERCLNRRHKESRCALCLACPTGAVTATGSTIQVDAAACRSCGLCFSVCPTEAFAVQGPSLPDLLRIGAEWRGQALEVACLRRPAASSASTDAAAVLVLPCLAWLSEALAVAWVAAGVSRLYLDDTHCATCEIGDARGPFTEASARAESLLRAAGRPESIALVSAMAADAPARTVPVIDPKKPAYSRRGLFGALSRSVAQAAATAADERMPSSPARKLAPLNPSQSALQAAAVARLAAQAETESTGTEVPVGSIVVGEACTACGLCTKLCPTGAVVLHQNEEAYQLEVTTARCLGSECGLCRLVCPVQAVSVVSTSSLAEAGSGSARVLRAGALTKCAKCGTPTAATEGEVLCHVCSWTSRVAAGRQPGK